MSQSPTVVTIANPIVAGPALQVPRYASRTMYPEGCCLPVAPLDVPEARSRSTLTAVTATSAASAWAAGSPCTAECAGASPVTRPLIEHWNGTKWSIVASPHPAKNMNILAGISAPSATNAWAVGYTGTATLTLRWNGTRWATRN